MLQLQPKSMYKMPCINNVVQSDETYIYYKKFKNIEAHHVLVTLHMYLQNDFYFDTLRRGIITLLRKASSI